MQGVRVTQQIASSTTAYRNEAAKLAPLYASLTRQQKEFAAAGKYSELQRDLKLTTQQAEELRKAFDAAEKAQPKPGRRVSAPAFPTASLPAPSTKPATGGGLGGLLGGNVGAGALGSLAATAGIALGANEAIKLLVTSWAEYGKVLSEVSAITGLTGKDLQFLDQQAQEIEASTGIAGTSILEAFKNIGSIAPALLENKELLAATTKEVVALSQASGLSLPESAQAALGALNQFGEGADQAGRFVNVLAAGALKGASEINETAEALKNSGTAMKAAGLSFEQGNSLVQSLAGVMIKGAEAGTGLRNVLLKLETSADKNLRPSIVGLDKALENAAKKYDTTTELTKAFGVENVLVARRILDTRAEITKMTEDITGTGVAYDQARINTGNLATDLQKAATSFTALFRSIGQDQDGLLRHLTQGFTAFLQSLTKKTGEARAFLTATFKNIISFDLGLSDGLKAFNDARQANRTNAANQAAYDGVRTAALNSVAGETADLEKLYVKQGQTVVSARKSAAAAVSKQRSEEVNAARKEGEVLKAAYLKANGAEKEALKERLAIQRQRVTAGVVADNAAKAQVARLAKAEADRAAAISSAAGETAAKTPEEKAAESAAKKAQAAREAAAKLLVKAQKDYQAEILKLEEEFGKDRLRRLDKDSDAYLVAQRDIQLKELDLAKKQLIKLGQLATSTQTRKNTKTGELEIVANVNYKLPLKTAKEFEDAKTEIENNSARDRNALRIRREYDLLELQRDSDQLELLLFDKKWEGILAIEKAGTEKFLAQIAKRNRDRKILETDIALKNIAANESIFDSNISLRKQGGDETATAFNRRNALDRNANQRFFNENRIEELTRRGDVNDAPEIQRLRALGKAIDEERKKIEAGPKYNSVFDLLGITNGLDSTATKQLEESVAMIGDAIRAVTQIQIEESDRRIAAIEAEIEAKQTQIDEEKERAEDGYANNLELRQQELADLKVQKAAEEAEKRKALKTQQELDTLSILSNNAVAVANLITSATAAFKAYSGIPFVGIALAIAAAATIYSSISALAARAKTITKLRDGGLVGPNGRSHERGGHRIEGTDIEVEGGEFVTKKKVTDKHYDALESLNNGNAFEAAMLLFRSVQLPPLRLPDSYSVGADMSQAHFDRLAERLVNELGGRLDKMHGKAEKIPLGDGRVMITEGSHTTIKKF